MIDTILNLLFRCRHNRLTRPVTLAAKEGEPRGDTYVVCLDCGKQFSYDLKQMRMGKPLPKSGGVGIMPPGMPPPHRSKLKLAVMAILPVCVAMLSIFTSRRDRKTALPAPKGEPPAKPSRDNSGLR